MVGIRFVSNLLQVLQDDKCREKLVKWSARNSFDWADDVGR